jgi:hypothetical protein
VDGPFGSPVRSRAAALRNALQQQANDMRVAEHAQAEAMAREMLDNGADSEGVARWLKAANDRTDGRIQRVLDGLPLDGLPFPPTF